jgi:hypothetical protein
LNDPHVMKSPKTDAATMSGDARTTQPRTFALLRLQAALEPRAGARYHVDQLFAFHDRAFVESAYAATLGRAPTDDELSATLADLRTSRREKRKIVEDLIESQEGAQCGARSRVDGIEGAGWKRRARRLPVIGYLWQLLASVARLPVSLRHQREFETYALAQQQLIAEHFNAQARAWDEQARARDAATDELRRRADSEGGELRAMTNELRRMTDELRRRLDAEGDELRRLFDDAHAAVCLLSDALASLTTRQAEARADFERGLDGQQEFLTREQFVIVEAQKAALAEIEGRLSETLAIQADALAKLSSRVADMSACADDEPRASPGGARGREDDDVETR